MKNKFRIFALTSIVLLGSVDPGLTYFSLLPQAYASTKLGDLSKFKQIASDTNALVKKNDLAGAKARIKDLETTWDEAEAGIKPRAAKDWHQLDKAIDRALDALRSRTPEVTTCQKAMTDLLGVFDQLEK